MTMFSSITHFLPSSIQSTLAPTAPAPKLQPEEGPPPPSNFDPSTDDEGDEEDLIRQQSQKMDEHQDDKRRVKSKKEKDSTKSATETFIFVRPPPSKTNHPLNLQVQLVPPNARAPSGVSIPGSEPTTPRSASTTSSDGASLARVPSNRSDYSSNFASNSTASFASVASRESGASSATSSTRSARRIIPLYNLHAHNVLTNVIADAGTDAKIAKFQKKGLELMDLAVLEPVEVWGVRNKSGEKEARKQGLRISVDEMGSVVHTGEGINIVGGARSLKNGGNLLQPRLQRLEDRSGTTSASSSALSLNSNSTHFSIQPHVMISPPFQHSAYPPASAPPQSSTFPVGIAQTPAPPAPDPFISQDTDNAHDPHETPSTTSTPVKKFAAAAGIFGRLKFNAKRTSGHNPVTSSPEPSSPPISPSQRQDQPNEFAEFSMAPMACHQTIQELERQARVAKTLLPPNSPGSINSDTPTPTPTTPNPQYQRSQRDDDSSIASPTPTVLLQKPGFIATLDANGNGSPSPPPRNINAPAAPAAPQGKNISFGGALSRVGRNRFINGIKTAAVAPINPERGAIHPVAVTSPLASSSANPPRPSTPTQTAGGPKGFFNKIAAGISGGGDRNSAANPRGPSGSRDIGTSRESVDSTTSGPFGRRLHHTGSQQFIGRGSSIAGPSTSGNSSANPSPRPSHEMSVAQQEQLRSATSSGSANMQQLGPGQVQVHSHHGNQLSLRQLQLRPYVLGIQPTYVSASQSYADQHASALSLALSSDGRLVEEPSSITNGGSSSGPPLTKVDSLSSLGGDSEKEFAGLSKGKRRSRKVEGSARESLNFDRESLAAAGASNTALSVLPKEKERALMYVWMVGRWLKKRGTGGWMTEHVQSASEVNGVGRNARDLFHTILPGRDRGNGAVEREAKRGSWHAGAGIGLIPSLGALGSHSHQPSSSSGKPLVLGPVVGGGLEVRFEWKRAKTRSSSRRNKEGGEEGADGSKRGRKAEKEKEKGRASPPKMKERDMGKEGGEVDNDDTPRITQGPVADTSPRKMTLAERKKLNRASTVSASSFGDDRASYSRVASNSPSRRSTGSKRNRLSLVLKSDGNYEDEDEEGGRVGEYDDDEDSDPEDSETPWVCTLKIRRVAHVLKQQHHQHGRASTTGVAVLPISSETGTAKSEKEQSLRLKVGTLSPTPHHPKVVAMLKVPFPLPEVEVERMEIVKKRKELFGQNVAEDRERDQREPYYGLTLTAEDIKDIVCSTGLWLVVREGFGGVGKVSRKGDGWKIRG